MFRGVCPCRTLPLQGAFRCIKMAIRAPILMMKERELGMRSALTAGTAFAATLKLPFLAFAAEAGGHAPHLDGAELGLIWAIPFAGILLSIAIFPLVAPHFWEHHFG